MINKIKENIYQLYFNEFGSCVYIIKLKDPIKIIMIDTSTKENAQELLNNLNEIGIEYEDIDVILLTHQHWDHNANILLFPEAKVYDSQNIKEFISEFQLPGLKVIHTPGHTKDSIAFLYKDILFSGDTIFHNSGIGRTDLPESQPEKMQESVNKLLNLNYKILCPGHID